MVPLSAYEFSFLFVRGRLWLWERCINSVYICLCMCVFLTRAKLRASVNPAAARSCLNSSVSLFSGNCENMERIHEKTHTIFDGIQWYLVAHTRRRKPRHLVGYGVGAWCGTSDVVESVGHGGVLHDVTGMDDIRARGWDLDLNLITNTGRLGQQAHPSQQLSDFLSWLAVRRKENKRGSLKCMTRQVSEDKLTPSSWLEDG